MATRITWDLTCGFTVPPAGFEPALTAPEAVALSPELRGLRTPQGYQSRRPSRAARVSAEATAGCPLPPVSATRAGVPGVSRSSADVGGASRTVIRVSGAGSRGQCREDATLARVAQGLGRVLVVDDDEVIRQLIAVNLTLEGFDVATAVDGQDCLDKVTAIDPDVITLDIMMPRLDGWMTASLLRRNPETSAIKVVLITARAQEDDKTRGRQIGVDAYLTKPFDPSEMIRVVRELAGHPPVADPA